MLRHTTVVWSLANGVPIAALVNANVVEASISESSDVMDVVDSLKRDLPFPDWCASGWDSIDDAFQELRQAWSFPLVLVVHELKQLIASNTHLGLEAVLRLSNLSSAFSAARDQLFVAYIWEA